MEDVQTGCVIESDREFPFDFMDGKAVEYVNNIWEENGLQGKTSIGLESDKLIHV